MKGFRKFGVAVVFLTAIACRYPAADSAGVKVTEGTITVPSYPWEEDVNPKFWAMEGGSKLSTTVKGAIVYPYTMQDHLLRTKVDRSYKALFLENEYLKVTCLPELGGRIHSVLDKTEGKQMFHLNEVIKPGMIAMRGAWISGGIEWNTGPHGHTVTSVSPVDVVTGENEDGSAFIEINNCEKIFRTRWTVRVTLRPGKAYLEERIRMYNPTDGMHPYYFWNCTAYPNKPGTRFIYPMTLGTDHNGTEFFNWPIHQGRDLTWLKNYQTPSSVFSVDCQYDFFGAYDVDDDRGIVQVADHRELSGKKAWTWGQSDFGLVSQESICDPGDQYIEVQSGPLPTQSDYGMLGPRDRVTWQEWWYPVHGLGDGFEYATRDTAVQTERRDGKLTLRILATGRFPEAICQLARDGKKPVSHQIELSPEKAQVVTLADAGDAPVEVTIKTRNGFLLSSFTTPLPIPDQQPPDPAKFIEKPEDQLTVEEVYLKGRKADRATDRLQAREYYEMAVKADPRHVPSLRALAVLDVEAGLYESAAGRLQEALERDSDDGLSWFYLGVCRFRTGDFSAACDCGYRAARCFGTVSLGYDLAGRAHMRLSQRRKAVTSFAEAMRANSNDVTAINHLAIALYAAGNKDGAAAQIKRRTSEDPTDLVPQALAALDSDEAMARFVRKTRDTVGEDDFQMLETALTFADLGLTEEAARLLAAVCVDPLSAEELSPLPLYYLAYFASLVGDRQAADSYLDRAAGLWRDFVFPSRAQAVDVLKYAISRRPKDAHAELQLGNLLANFGRLDEALGHWKKAARLKPSLGMAFRNLGIHQSTMEENLTAAEDSYRKAISACPDDQTLYRDLAEILIAAGKRPEAIQLLETMPFENMRRAEIIIVLAQAYFDENRFDETLALLESTPYFVNWEGQDITWSLFNRARVARGRKLLDSGKLEAALAEFETALSYPDNLGVGRPNKPQEALAQYWRGKALETQGRIKEAKAAWTEGAAGAKGPEEQVAHVKLCKQALGSNQ